MTAKISDWIGQEIRAVNMTSHFQPIFGMLLGVDRGMMLVEMSDKAKIWMKIAQYRWIHLAADLPS